jgi:cytochrome c-type biogenesis protein CcmH
MLKATRLITLLGLFLLAASSLPAAEEPLEFDSPEQEARYRNLTEELRCAVCQNQNLADSDAPLAQDLRREIYEMMLAGQTDDAIKSFMVDRYGDFVLYRPPVQGNTVALWVMPGAVLLVGAAAVFATVRKRNRRLAAQKQEGSS